MRRVLNREIFIIFGLLIQFIGLMIPQVAYLIEELSRLPESEQLSLVAFFKQTIAELQTPPIPPNGLLARMALEALEEDRNGTTTDLWQYLDEIEKNEELS